MRLVGSLLLLALGCLDAPPATIDQDGDGGARDAAPSGSDSGGISCPGTLDLPLDEEADLDGWTPDLGASCSYAVTPDGLKFTNTGAPASCRLYRDEVLDMRSGELSVRLSGDDPHLAMSFSVILGPAELDFADRRWIFFERDQDQILLGECTEGFVCYDTEYGLVPYDAGLHAWLRFRHQRETDQLHFETSSDGAEWQWQAAAEDVTFDDLYCVGIDLASYEEQASGTTDSSSFSELSGGPPPAVTRR